MNVVAFRTKEIKMMCIAAGQPVYLENVSWADIGLRERQPNEPVHYREEQGDPCQACGEMGGVWMTSESSHATHPARCDKDIPAFLK